MSICNAVTPFSVPATFKVHVAEMVLVTEDVGEHEQTFQGP